MADTIEYRLRGDEMAADVSFRQRGDEVLLDNFGEPLSAC
jgi:hypothetical protein